MSKHFFTFNNHDEKRIIFHAPSSTVLMVKEGTLSEEVTDKYFYQYLPHLKGKVNQFEEHKDIGKGKVGLTFMSARSCNLSCRYCFAGEGEYGSRSDKPVIMKSDMYLNAIESVEKLYPEGVKSISFFGGEPLLGLKEIKDFIGTCRKFYEEKGETMPYLGISTNGTIMNCEIAEFIASNKIAVVLSLDGIKPLNDSARINKDSWFSVYDKVCESIRLLKEYGVVFHIEMTVTKRHLNQYRPGVMQNWLDEFSRLGYVNLVIVPVETDVPDLTINSDEDYQKLDLLAREATNYYIEELLKETPISVSTTFTNTFIQIARKTTYRGCTAGRHLFVDTDGNLYPCHMFCNDDSFLLGNAVNGELDTVKMKENVGIDRFSAEECSECISQNLCRYWCKGLQYNSHHDMYKLVKARCIFQNAILEEGIKAYSIICNNKTLHDRFLRNLSAVNDTVKESIEPRRM